MLFKSIIAAVSAFAGLSAAAPANIRASNVIEGSYIVKLKDNVATDKHLSWVSGIHARRNVNNDVAGVEREYNSPAFHGYAGQFDQQTIVEIESSPEVAYVEADQIWTLEESMEKRDLTTQESAPWGLAAISHRQPNATGYIYDTAAGQGTFGYVMDTGIRATHREFEGRASTGWTGWAGDDRDISGHGTHVAGTVGGVTFGVAKKATIIAVKVFHGTQTSTSIIMGGFDWAVNDIVSKGRQDKSVINQSLGGPYSRAWNDAIEAAFTRGVLSVIAAGNAQRDASEVSPASAPNAVTVGAVDKNWRIVTNWPNGQGSNYGPVLDIFAPGDGIESAEPNSDSQTGLRSGTSMASPHVAGLALYAMSVDGVRGAQAVTDHLIKNSGKGVVTGPLRGSPNRFANNGNPSQ
ncbi:peptidase S8 family protein, Pr1D [Metarhizium robertsii]|uniref:Peptidase S8, subtilisin, Asp-active site protein n=3 Tax=Metarhizium TaxID=5529 RepID=E9F8W9_METRA|nr:Peptidase S8, subtilisin, Asp-active site protein [Metarhizium robertsii ARSEF 23]EFY95737.1 Peptidase S8, subtilisin, Asp-active site protein [Metarhizium robertsii ARSEF 23]EXU96871.1 peptidase S8 family protein, Pr1D [Metarhizium robertsii]CAB89873.1 subtilisin-like protease PR1D [Metarhizium anisopliae]